MKITEFFKNIFANNTIKNKMYQSLKLLNEFQARYLNYGSKHYDHLIYRSCIDVLAKQIAKLTPDVKLVTNDKYYSNLKWLLNYQPNEYMNRFDFFYKTASILFDTNNCFIYKRVIDEKIVGFYPIPYSEIEFVEYDNDIYAKFRFNRGFEVYIPYNELIHLRRHYNSNDLFGSAHTVTLTPILEVLKAIDSGMINSVEASTQLRGIIKYSGNLRKEDLDKYKDDFVNSYMSITGDGIGILDSKCDFVPLTVNPKSVNALQHELVLNYFSYSFGVSKSILLGSATESDYNTFYELTIEPLLVQLSLEFTNKIFTRYEIENGCEILLTANKLLFTGVSTKTTLAKDVLPMGLFSINEVREMYGYNPIDNGDRHIISLNYIDLSKANEYQSNKNINGKNNDGNNN